MPPCSEQQWRVNFFVLSQDLGIQRHWETHWRIVCALGEKQEQHHHWIRFRPRCENFCARCLHWRTRLCRCSSPARPIRYARPLCEVFRAHYWPLYWGADSVHHYTLLYLTLSINLDWIPGLLVHQWQWSCLNVRLRHCNGGCFLKTLLQPLLSFAAFRSQVCGLDHFHYSLRRLCLVRSNWLRYFAVSWYWIASPLVRWLSQDPFAWSWSLPRSGISHSFTHWLRYFGIFPPLPPNIATVFSLSKGVHFIIPRGKVNQHLVKGTSCLPAIRQGARIYQKNRIVYSTFFQASLAARSFTVMTEGGAPPTGRDPRPTSTSATASRSTTGQTTTARTPSTPRPNTPYRGTSPTPGTVVPLHTLPLWDADLYWSCFQGKN